MKPIRVLIAEDSPTISYYLKQIINAAAPLQVVGIARDGEEVLAMTEHAAPDVISMDVQMPRLDGLEATRRIMRHHPTPVVIVSGLLEREIDLALRALQAGALAVVPKPPAETDPDFADMRYKLVYTLRAMAGVRVIRRWATVYEVTPPANNRRYQTQGLRRPPELIAVAASAGGPSALATLIGGLQNELGMPMVIVQHMPGEFLDGLARWLGKFTDLTVKIAKHNEILRPGVVHLAPGNKHLRIQRQGEDFLSLLDANMGNDRYQPSANVLFKSVALAAGERGMGVILTGMGDDGAAGLLAMYEANARTIVQDEASSTVFGMPMAALQLGAAEQVLSPVQIAAAIRKLV